MIRTRYLLSLMPLPSPGLRRRAVRPCDAAVTAVGAVVLLGVGAAGGAGIVKLIRLSSGDGTGHARLHCGDAGLEHGDDQGPGR